MFSHIPSFFNVSPNATVPSDLTAAFAGVPLQNPLLSDPKQNIEQLDERIKQLESVANWLQLNLQMVNASVQQLQVQKQTLHALGQWQEMTKTALAGFVKANEPESEQEEPVAEPEAAPAKAQKEKSVKTASQKASEPLASPTEPDMAANLEQMAQSWWAGLQQQFAQVAQPVMDNSADVAEVKPKAKPRVRKTVVKSGVKS